MKRSATYLLGVLLLLAAGSCSVQKKCKAPQLDMPAEIVAGQSDTLTLSDRKWWEVYTDTTLCRADRPHARPQPQHALGRGAHPPAGGALPRKQGGPAAVAGRAGRCRLRDQRLLRRSAQGRRRVRRESHLELGGRPVGQPALGQAQGRGRIPRLGRGGRAPCR